MNINLAFDIANLFVLPFWALIIFLPNWGVTKKVMSSYVPFIILVGFYIFFFANTLNAESAEALSNPDLPTISQFFGEESAAATGWAHFLVMDLFVGRWVYWQGQEKGIFTVHSIILCLFAGPIGLLSHIITAWITEQFFKKSETTEATSS
nr:ABA4-like family protein [Halothece sp. PCC 7418]